MKKLFKLILLSTGFLFAYVNGSAQVDFGTLALTFAQTDNGGTARIIGLGGATTALGGDLNSISANPAGLGFYNRSEVGLSPSIYFNGNSTDFLGSTMNSNGSKFSIGNLGIVFKKKKRDVASSGWRGGNFGFSYNRINAINDQVNYSGLNQDNDYLDFIIDYANYPEPVNVGDYYLVDMPFYTYLINDYTSDGTDTTFGEWGTFIEYASPDSPVRQTERITRKGKQDQFSFSYGGNFSDKFYFGFGIGVVSLKYEDEKLYSEDRYEESILNYFDLYEYQIIEGTGINAMLGIIFRPLESMTVGINYQTRTAYGLVDGYTTTLRSVWNNNANDIYGADPNFVGDHTDEQSFLGADALSYTLKTPGKLSGGIAYFINKNGFITADIDWINYGKSKFESEQYEFNGDNASIKNSYKSVINFRLGGEYRNGIMRIRAGYNFQGDPYSDKEGVNRSINTISGGVGIRKKVFYLDLAVQHAMTEKIRAPYIIYEDQQIGPTPVAEIKMNTTKLVLSAGFFF